MSKKEYYSEKEIVSKYHETRYAGKSGIYVNDREINAVAKLLDKEGKVLDVACGQGRLNRIFDGFDVTGLDYSKEMLNFCKVQKNYKKVVCGDALNLPFSEHVFDYVVTMRFFFHYSNIKDYLKEFKRVSKKNGFIIFQTYRWSPRMFFNIKKLGGKIYIHPDKKIIKILKELNLKFVEKECCFLFSPFVYKNLPYFLVKVLNVFEKIVPSFLKVDVYWKVKK